MDFLATFPLTLLIEKTSGKPRLTHVANSASGIHAVGLGRVEASNKPGGEKKETLVLIKIHV